MNAIQIMYFLSMTEQFPANYSLIKHRSLLLPGFLEDATMAALEPPMLWMRRVGQP
jgi:hypothetical protein